jgi:hypothetical protein
MLGTSDANGPEGGTDRQRANWRKAERFIRNPRQRLFRASQEVSTWSRGLVVCLSRMR